MYFDNCKNLEELKKLYKQLVMQHHPDMGGDLETMKAINIEHDRVFEILKRHQNTEAQTNSNVKATTETPEEFRRIVEMLIKIDDIDIELCGSWLWIGGDTYDHRTELKAAGCMWSKSKKKWYWRHAEDGARWSRGKYSMNDIRLKYGSAQIKATEEQVKLSA